MRAWVYIGIDTAPTPFGFVQTTPAGHGSEHNAAAATAGANSGADDVFVGGADDEWADVRAALMGIGIDASLDEEDDEDVWALEAGRVKTRRCGSPCNKKRACCGCHAAGNRGGSCNRDHGRYNLLGAHDYREGRGLGQEGVEGASMLVWMRKTIKMCGLWRQDASRLAGGGNMAQL